MGEHPRIDARMEVGAVNESVNITADSPLIEATNASIGQVITSKEVESIPVNGRTPLMLAQLALGAVSTVEPGTQVRPFDNNTPASFASAALLRAPTNCSTTARQMRRSVASSPTARRRLPWTRCA